MGELNDKDPERQGQTDGFSYGVEQFGHYESDPDYCEDAYLAMPQEQVFAVFDALGGKGFDLAQEASAYATTALEQSYRSAEPLPTLEKEIAYLDQQLVDLNKQLVNYDSEAGDDAIVAATTATVARLWQSPEGKNYAIIANCGDSRAYRLTASGELQQLTVDNMRGDTFEPVVQRRRAQQLESANYADAESAEAAAYFSKRHLLMNALGLDPDNFWPRTDVVELMPGDILLLTSDGVHDNLTDDEIKGLISQPGLAGDIATRLSKAARDRYGDSHHPRAKEDDITALVVKIS